MYSLSTSLQPGEILETHFVAARQRVRATLYRAAFFVEHNRFVFCFVLFFWTFPFVPPICDYRNNLSPLNCANKNDAPRVGLKFSWL